MNFYRIYQLPHNDNKIFRSHKDNSMVDLGDYCCVWTNSDVDFSKEDKVICEDLFTKFNVGRPKEFGGHSMSVSDIVVIYRDDVPKTYYCQPAGFDLVDVERD